MIILENRTNVNNEREDGYFLSIKQLETLVVDFAVDWHDGFVSNHREYIEGWLRKENGNEKDN